MVLDIILQMYIKFSINYIYLFSKLFYYFSKYYFIFLQIICDLMFYDQQLNKYE